MHMYDDDTWLCTIQREVVSIQTIFVSFVLFECEKGMEVWNAWIKDFYLRTYLYLLRVCDPCIYPIRVPPLQKPLLCPEPMVMSLIEYSGTHKNFSTTVGFRFYHTLLFCWCCCWWWLLLFVAVVDNRVIDDDADDLLLMLSVIDFIDSLNYSDFSLLYFIGSVLA